MACEGRNWTPDLIVSSYHAQFTRLVVNFALPSTVLCLMGSATTDDPHVWNDFFYLVSQCWRRRQCNWKHTPKNLDLSKTRIKMAPNVSLLFSKTIKRIKTLFWRSHPIANFLWKKVFLIFVRKCVGWSRTKTSRAKILLRYVLNCRRMVPNIPWQVTVNRIDTNNERLLSETTPMLSTVRLNPHNLFSF